MTAIQTSRRPRKTPSRRSALADLGDRLPRAEMPATPQPMLCTLVAEAFDHPGWVFEPKYDGLRILGRFDGRELTLLSRYGQSQNFQFPDVVAALRKSLTRPAIVD